MPDGAATRKQPVFPEQTAVGPDGEVARVEWSGDQILAATTADGPLKVAPQAPTMGDAALLPLLETQGVEIVNRLRVNRSWFWSPLPWRH